MFILILHTNTARVDKRFAYPMTQIACKFNVIVICVDVSAEFSGKARGYLGDAEPESFSFRVRRRRSRLVESVARKL